MLGKHRGYVSYDELNNILPETEISAEDIEAIVDAISELGIELTWDG